MYVLDANVVVAAGLKSAGTPMQAVLAAREYGTLALSRAVYAEYDDVLHRPKFESRIGHTRITRLLDLLVVAATWHEPTEQVTACRDAKDNAYLSLAAAAGAGCIISGDDDLLVLNPWRGIEVMRPAAFMNPVRGEARTSAAIDAAIRERYGDVTDPEKLRFLREHMRASWPP